MIDLTPEELMHILAAHNDGDHMDIAHAVCPRCQENAALEVIKSHEAGEHTDKPVFGCQLCIRERDAIEKVKVIGVTEDQLLNISNKAAELTELIDALLEQGGDDA